jgi:hypothetical protein
MRRLVALTGASLLAIGIAACGLPTDDEFVEIDAADDGFGLSQTSTTSTTLPPTTTIDATTSTTIEITTTSIASEQVDIYFPTGRQLNRIQVPLPIDPALSQVMAAIVAGPPVGDLGIGLRAILPSNAEIAVEKVDGIAVVDFPVGLFDEMEPRDQRLVFGQIVLTLSRQRGVGPVMFTQAGQPMQVYLGDGSLTNPDDSVSADDYTILLSSSGQPIETTTTPPPTVAPTVDPAAPTVPA